MRLSPATTPTRIHIGGNGGDNRIPNTAGTAVLLVWFMLLDAVLSLAFRHWPLLRPNHFGSIDGPVYRLDWSPPAKALNTAAVVLAVAAGNLPVALAVASAQLLLKVWSARRVLRLIDADSSPADRRRAPLDPPC